MKPQLGSSAGFKKRSLLRPSSGLTRERQFLKTIDISQSESIISSTIRSQLSIIQQSINLLDKDKRIRGQQNSLQKSYISVLKKWIREYGSLSPQTQKQDDDGKILKYIGGDSYQSGFKKLWKVICHLDLMICKIMELQIVHLVKYDDFFDKIVQDSEIASGMLSAIANRGFNPAMFHVVRVGIQRSNQLYSYAADLKRKTIYDESSSNKNNETFQLIEQLKKQNSKLTQLIQDLSSKPKSTKQITNNISNSQSSYEELQSKYKQHINDLTLKNQTLLQQISQNKVYISTLEKQLSMLKQQIQQIRQQKKTNKNKLMPGSFQEALQQEMEKMKNGFQRKIRKLLQDQQLYEKQSRKKQNQYRIETQKLRWQKGLLMKKFDLQMHK